MRTMRAASEGDARLLWAWANDPEARARSFTPGEIPFDRHLAWLRARLASPGSRIYILEEGGVPVAQVRFDRVSDKEAEIDVSVAPLRRGRGLGTEALVLSRERARADLGVASVVGVVHADNLASRGAFARAGFAEAGRRTVSLRECVLYRWPPP